MPTEFESRAVSSGEASYNDTDEVEFFISVTKLPSWTHEELVQEYSVVHTEMARQQHKVVGLPLRYVQASASEPASKFTGNTESDAGWDFVTCLTWPSLHVIWSSFQDEAYKKTAGKHIFCRLDNQKGAIMKKYDEYNPVGTEEGASAIVPGAQILMFHRRSSSEEEATPEWLRERLQQGDGWKLTGHIHGYTLWKDVTPKDTQRFFCRNAICGRIMA